MTTMANVHSATPAAPIFQRQLLREIRQRGGVVGGLAGRSWPVMALGKPGRAAIEVCIAAGWLDVDPSGPAFDTRWSLRRLRLTSLGDLVAGHARESMFAPELSQDDFLRQHPVRPMPGGYGHDLTGDQIWPGWSGKGRAGLAAYGAYCDKRRATLAGANWARVGQRVLVIADGRMQGDTLEEMEGVILERCVTFPEYVHVAIPPTGRRRRPIHRMMRIDQLEPLEADDGPAGAALARAA